MVKIKLGQLLNSLSFALDIAENRYFNHSRRTSYIAYAVGKELNLDEETLMNTYYLSLIHDIGMAGYLSRYSVEYIHENLTYRKKHCCYGEEILDKIPYLKDKKDIILYHHEEYNGTGPFGLKGEEIPLISQIIHIADFFELYYIRQKGNIFEIANMDNVNRWVKKYRNIKFSSRICDALMAASLKEKFWFDLTNVNLDKVLYFIEEKNSTLIDMKSFKEISEAFSLLIDMKSKFTYEHSQGISKITSNFATFLGYNPLMIEKLTIAGNLHDIGKFVVPTSLLEKPGKLNNEEFFKVKSHVYYTKLILKQIDGIEDIANWAGNHHEKLTGNGYPEKLNERTLTKEDQIIAIADIYQALTEDRPYRKGMNSNDAIGIMSTMVDKGEISRSLFLDFKHLVSYQEVL